MKKYYLRLDIQKQVDTDYIQVIKQDTLANTLYITLLNAGELIPMSEFTFVEVVADKPDATQWISSGEVLGNGQVKVDLEYQAISAVGVVDISLKLYTGESIMTTYPFQLRVIPDPNAGTDASVESASEYPILTGLIQAVQEAGTVSQNMLVWEAYNGSTAYEEGNKVSYNGSSYYCIQDCTGVLPTNTAYWTLIASKGDKGDKGDTGDTGLQGIQGEQGNSVEYLWNGTQLGIRIEGDAAYTYVDLKGEQGIQGIQGDTGNGIASVVRTSGTGAAGTTDTYTITFTDSTTTTFNVYNGADGLGTGDMLKSVYDTDNDGKVNSAVNADTVNGKTVAENVPVGAVFTDDQTASEVLYSNTTSGLTATTVQDAIDEHNGKNIDELNGVHGLRYYNDVLSYYNGTTWIEIETGSGGVAPGNVSGIDIAPGSGVLKIKFTDPDDTAWAGTKVVMKAGSYPNNERDGTVILDNTTKNAYSANPFTQSGLTNGTTYYFGLFPYSADGAVNYNVVNRGTGTPVAYQTMGITIDLANSNPETAVVYTDDAVGMTGGSLDWDTKFPFTQIKPCMLKNGVVQYYLDPTDYTKKADGTAADITSGNDGDVMIEIPKMAYMIYTEGNYIYVKVTDNPNAKAVDSRFSFYAHTRDVEGDREKLYIGAYLGHDLSSKLRSLSGKAPYAGGTAPAGTIETCRTLAQANGAGYDQVSFYPLTLLQCLYVIRFKNLDSQTAIGRGYVDGNSAAVNTGGANTRGMYYGEGTGQQQMKFLGIEDFWGNLRWWIDGLFSDASYNILTAFKNFNDTGSGYTNRGQGATVNLANYMSKPQGTTETGFIAKEVAGSATTYYADYAYLYASGLPIFGGAWTTTSAAGAFYLAVNTSASTSSSNLGGRLMYL